MSIVSKHSLGQASLLLFELAAGAVLFFCLCAQPAKAYADPGSGALLYQLILASIVSVGFHFRKLLCWFRRDDKLAAKGTHKG
jgi:hypothetical protein